MQFEFCVDIEAPPELVWQLFDDPQRLPSWQPDLQTYEAVSGEPGWPGTVSLLVYQQQGQRGQRGRVIETTETIIAREEGRHRAGRYENTWASNDMACTFQPLPGGGTRWRAYAEFRFKGWVQLMAPLMRSGIRKRLEDDMLRFKAMAEREHEQQLQDYQRPPTAHRPQHPPAP